MEQSWVDKYDRCVVELNKFTVQQITQWLQQKWTKGTALFVHGPPGSGKTSSCRQSIIQCGLQPVEVEPYQLPSITVKQGQCIVIDGIDGDLAKVKQFVPLCGVPVICLQCDPWSKDARSLKEQRWLSHQIEVPPVSSTDIFTVLKHIVTEEHLTTAATNFQLRMWSTQHHGDLRSAINSLQFHLAAKTAVMTADSSDNGPSGVTVDELSSPVDPFTATKRLITTRRMPDERTDDVEFMFRLLQVNYVEACVVGAFHRSGRTDMDSLGRISRASEALSRYGDQAPGEAPQEWLACWSVASDCYSAPDRLEMPSGPTTTGGNSSKRRRSTFIEFGDVGIEPAEHRRAKKQNK